MEATDKEIILKAAEIMDRLLLSNSNLAINLGSCHAITSAYRRLSSPLTLFAEGSFYLKQKYCKFYQQPMATLWDVTNEERVLLLLFFAEAGDL